MKNLGLEPYYKKLKSDALLKSIIFASMIGFSLMLFMSLGFYLISYNGLIITLVTGILTILILSILFQKRLFKTTLKSVAVTLDLLDLDERVLTMIEHHDQETLVTQKQRETTQEKLRHIKPSHIAFKHFLRLTFILIFIMTLSIVTLTLSTIAVLDDVEDPIIPDIVLTDEEALIAELIEELREIIKNADVSVSLKDELNLLVDALEDRIKLDNTTILKIARIEETRRVMLEKIASELNMKTTIIDELILNDSTNTLGEALKTENEQIITQTLEAIIEAFLELSISDMQQFVDTFEMDVESSIERADIKNQPLENDLRAFVELLKSLIPEIEGEEPQDVSEDVEDLVESLLESLETLSPEASLQEVIDETIQEVIDALQEDEIVEEPEEPEEEEEPGDDEPWDPLDQEDSEVNGSPEKNLNVIDGLTIYDATLYDAMLEELLELFESNQITDEALIEIINNYLNSIKIN